MSVKANAVVFLQALGFSDVRVVQGETIRLMVRNTIKQVRKCLKAKNTKFTLTEQSTLPRGTAQSFLVIQNRQIVGRMHVTSYTTHSIIELVNLA